MNYTHLITRVLDRYGPREYLLLDGPFKYPRWVQDPRRATPLTISQASAWSSCLPHGEPVSFEGLGLEAPEAAPPTEREAPGGSRVEKNATFELPPETGSYAAAWKVDYDVFE